MRTYKLRSKFLSISLLLLLTAPTVITFSWFQIKKIEVKRNVRTMIIDGVDNEELILLKFTAGDAEKNLRWEHSREFEYNHQMYDIVETFTDGKYIYYWCWWDREESELNQQLGAIGEEILNSNPRKKEKLSSRNSTSSLLFHCSNFNWLSIKVKPDFEFKNRNLVTYSLFSLPPPTPPPRRSLIT